MRDISETGGRTLWTQQLLEDLGAALRRRDNDDEVRVAAQLLEQRNLPRKYLVMKVRLTFGDAQARRLQEIMDAPVRARPRQSRRRSSGRSYNLPTQLRIWFRRYF